MDRVSLFAVPALEFDLGDEIEKNCAGQHKHRVYHGNHNAYHCHGNAVDALEGGMEKSLNEHAHEGCGGNALEVLSLEKNCARQGKHRVYHGNHHGYHCHNN